MLSPKYTMGAKNYADAKNKGKCSTGTTTRVGPGHYSPESWTNDSTKETSKKWTFDKSLRLKDKEKIW